MTMEHQQDVAESGRQVTEFLEQSQRVAQAFWQRQFEDLQGGDFQISDPQTVGRAFYELGTQLAANPARMVEAQMRLLQDSMALWQHTLARMTGQEAPPRLPHGCDPRRDAAGRAQQIQPDRVALEPRAARNRRIREEPATLVRVTQHDELMTGGGGGLEKILACNRPRGRQHANSPAGKALLDASLGVAQVVA